MSGTVTRFKDLWGHWSEPRGLIGALLPRALCALASLSAALFPLTSAILPNMAAGSQFACLGPQLGLEFLLILGC